MAIARQPASANIQPFQDTRKMSMSQYLSTFVTNFLFVLATLWPIINPPGGVPIFMTLTAHNSNAERAFLARRIAFYSFLLLIGSMYFGGVVLSFFGVEIPVVQVAGGLLISVAGWRMMNEAPAPKSAPDNTQDMSDHLKQQAFYPLTFPMMVGPGSISVAITVGASLSRKGTLLERFTIAPLAALAAITVICIAVWASLRYADRLLKFLGKTGTMVFMRLTAFILLCLGVQIMWLGISGLLEPLLGAR